MKKSLIAVGVATGLAFSLQAHAKGEGYGMQSSDRQSTSGSSQNMQSSGGQSQGSRAQSSKQQAYRAVIGEVVDTRVVQVRGGQGSTADHRLVRLRNQDGNIIVVDMGNAARVGAPQKGATLAVTGKQARINGDPVLFARYVGDLHPTGGIVNQARSSGGSQSSGQSQSNSQ